MRQKVREHRDAGGATVIALAMVLIYSLWGASVMHTDKSTHVIAGVEQRSLAVK